VKVASDYKRLRANRVRSPLLRGPARLAEAFAVIPAMRKRLPEARLPFQRGGVLGAMVVTAIAVRGVKSSRSLTPFARELIGGLLSAVPAALSLRGSELAAYHGAEHISIGSYEHGSPRKKEHERCGSHMLGPLLASSAVGGALASRAPAHLRGRAVREGQREDAVGRRPLGDEPGEALRQDPGLPGPGAGQDEQRAARVRDCFELGGAECAGGRRHRS